MKLTPKDISELRAEETQRAVKTLVILAVILVTALWLYILVGTFISRGI